VYSQVKDDKMNNITFKVAIGTYKFRLKDFMDVKIHESNCQRQQWKKSP